MPHYQKILSYMINHLCLRHLCDTVISFLWGKVEIMNEQLICFCFMSCDLPHRQVGNMRPATSL